MEKLPDVLCRMCFNALTDRLRLAVNEDNISTGITVTISVPFVCCRMEVFAVATCTVMENGIG